jgi:hypothetical protein
MGDDGSKPLSDASASLQTRWIYGRVPDIAIAWCWVPLYLIAHLMTRQHTAHADRTFCVMMVLVLVVSLLHQPLTLLLVYADAAQFRLHPRLFTWGPCVAVAVVAAIVILKLWVLLIPLVALWQVFHTQQQRYGILRVYSRKSGYGSARLDRTVCFVPLLCATTLLALSNTPRDQMARMGASLGTNNVAAVNLLFRLRPGALVLMPIAVIVFIAVVVATVRQERTRAGDAARNPARWNYLVGSAALLAGLVFDPAAGVLSYVFAHAAEYVIIVNRTLRSRYAREGSGKRPLLSVVAGTTAKRWFLLIAFFIAVLAVDIVMGAFTSASLYVIVLYTITLLHFVYDGSIWKTRKPAVAADFGIPSRAATSPA